MADEKITSTQGWAQLQHTLGKKMPRRLHASARARAGMRALMRGKGRR